MQNLTTLGMNLTKWVPVRPNGYQYFKKIKLPYSFQQVPRSSTQVILGGRLGAYF